MEDRENVRSEIGLGRCFTVRAGERCDGMILEAIGIVKDRTSWVIAIVAKWEIERM